jgi:hypothetical protein
MLTFKKVNAAIAARGIKAELVQGNGYLYFAGDDVQHAFTTSIAVCKLNHIDLSSLLDSLDAIVANSKERTPA